MFASSFRPQLTAARKTRAASGRSLLFGTSGALLFLVCTLTQGVAGNRTTWQAIALGVDEADVTLIGDTLGERGGYCVTRGSLSDLDGQIEGWVNAIESEARQAIFYYRGGLTLGNNRLPYLQGGTADSQSDRVALAKLLTNLAKFKGDSAVLLLDLNKDGLPAGLRDALQRALDGATADSGNCVLAVIAGSADPKAAAGTEGGASPLSYWISRGLRGDADIDLDGRVTLAELTDYLPDVLADTAEIVSVANTADLTSTCLIEKRPLKLDELLTDLADKLADELHQNGATLVAVPDFHLNVGLTAEDDVPGQDYGPLMRYSVTKLKREISARSNFKYRLVDGTWLRGLLNRHRIGPENIESEQMKALADEFERRLPGTGDVTLVVGGFQHTGGEEVTVLCTPWDAENGATYQMANGSARLNPSEWAMIGHSVVNREAIKAFQKQSTDPSPTRSQPPVTPASRSTVSYRNRQPKPLPLLDYFDETDLEFISREIARLERNSLEKHPLADADFPFKVWLTVNGQTPTPILSRDSRHVYYHLKENDRYMINVLNDSRHGVFMRLLVDGLNTLPDLPLVKADEANPLYEVAVKDYSAQLSPAEYVNLTDARARHCAPGRYAIQGFYTMIDRTSSGPVRDAEQAAFIVTDASDSEAWRTGYPKDVGIITAAFYTPMKRPLNMALKPRVGTKLGERSRTTVAVYEGQQVPGELLAVVHLRFESGFAEERIVFLTESASGSDRAATADNLRHQLSRLADAAGKNDLLFVAIASHAVQVDGNDLVCAADASAADLQRIASQEKSDTMVPLQEIVREMAVSASRNRFLMIDNAGSANPFTDAAKVTNGGTLADRFGSQPLQVHNGQWIVCSRSGRLHDVNDGSPPMTCFMSSVLDGLRKHADSNNNGHVSAFEISDYTQLHADTQGYAPPVLHGKTSADFALAATTEASPSVASLPVKLRELFTRHAMRAGYAALVAEDDADGAIFVFADAGHYLPSDELTQENYGLYLTALASRGEVDKALSLAQANELPLLVHVPATASVYEKETPTSSQGYGWRSSRYSERAIDTVQRGTLLNVTEVSQGRFRFDQSFGSPRDGDGLRHHPGKVKPGWVNTSSLKRQPKQGTNLGLTLSEQN